MSLHRSRELVKSLVVCGIVALASVAVALADGGIPLHAGDGVALTEDGGAPPFVVPAKVRCASRPDAAQVRIGTGSPARATVKSRPTSRCAP